MSECIAQTLPERAWVAINNVMRFALLLLLFPPPILPFRIERISQASNTTSLHLHINWFPCSCIEFFRHLLRTHSSTSFWIILLSLLVCWHHIYNIPQQFYFRNAAVICVVRSAWVSVASNYDRIYRLRAIWNMKRTRHTKMKFPSPHLNGFTLLFSVHAFHRMQRFNSNVSMSNHYYCLHQQHSLHRRTFRWECACELR